MKNTTFTTVGALSLLASIACADSSPAERLAIFQQDQPALVEQFYAFEAGARSRAEIADFLTADFIYSELEQDFHAYKSQRNDASYDQVMASLAYALDYFDPETRVTNDDRYPHNRAYYVKTQLIAASFAHIHNPYGSDYEEAKEKALTASRWLSDDSRVKHVVQERFD